MIYRKRRILEQTEDLRAQTLLIVPNCITMGEGEVQDAARKEILAVLAAYLETDSDSSQTCSGTTNEDFSADLDQMVTNQHAMFPDRMYIRLKGGKSKHRGQVTFIRSSNP